MEGYHRGSPDRYVTEGRRGEGVEAAQMNDVIREGRLSRMGKRWPQAQ